MGDSERKYPFRIRVQPEPTYDPERNPPKPTSISSSPVIARRISTTLRPNWITLRRTLLTPNATWPIASYTEWLDKAGFGDVRTLVVPSAEPVLLATRR